MALLSGLVIMARSSRLLEMALLFPSCQITSCHVMSYRIVSRHAALRFVAQRYFCGCHLDSRSSQWRSSHVHNSHSYHLYSNPSLKHNWSHALASFFLPPTAPALVCLSTFSTPTSDVGVIRSYCSLITGIMGHIFERLMWIRRLSGTSTH